jgi:acyl-CoA reductase-like NAD-dependent aldehyde dehydrogenase
MNVSGGSLVASIATDDPKVALRIRREVRAFKVGVNVLRSRGDRDELFGVLDSLGKVALSGEYI